MISVVIPTHRRGDLLREALRTVDRQTLRDFEVIVVNDGGPSVADAVAPWRERFALTLVECPRRRGASAARNVGVEHARGAYLAFLDDDDIFLPDHLRAAHDVLSRGDADLVYLAAMVSRHRVTECPPDRAALRHKAYPFDERFLHVANFIHTGSVVVRSVRPTPVRFDESLSHCEDWDMWLAIRRRLGFRFGYVDSVTSVYHQVPGTPGLLTEGQATVPSPFRVARDRIYERWPAGDEQTVEFRRWLSVFDRRCDEAVTRGAAVPADAFDRALAYLYQRFTAGRAADLAEVERVLATHDEVGQPRPSSPELRTA